MIGPILKYIRTKDGIHLRKIFDKECSDEEWESLGYAIINQADTIEELCDEFVYNNELLVPIYISPKESLIESWRNRLDDEFNYKGHKEIFGAIWTDKGLIYVAKMNEQGKWVLI